MKPEDSSQVQDYFDDEGESWSWDGADGHSYRADRYPSGDVEIRHSFFCKECKSLRDQPEMITMPYQDFLILIGWKETNEHSDC